MAGVATTRPPTAAPSPTRKRVLLSAMPPRIGANPFGKRQDPARPPPRAEGVDAMDVACVDQPECEPSPEIPMSPKRVQLAKLALRGGDEILDQVLAGLAGPAAEDQDEKPVSLKVLAVLPHLVHESEEPASGPFLEGFDLRVERSGRRAPESFGSLHIRIP